MKRFKKINRRFVSLLLSLIVIMGMLPLSAFPAAAVSVKRGICSWVSNETQFKTDLSNARDFILLFFDEANSNTTGRNHFNNCYNYAVEKRNQNSNFGIGVVLFSNNTGTFSNTTKNMLSAKKFNYPIYLLVASTDASKSTTPWNTFSTFCAGNFYGGAYIVNSVAKNYMNAATNIRSICYFSYYADYQAAANACDLHATTTARNKYPNTTNSLVIETSNTNTIDLPSEIEESGLNGTNQGENIGDGFLTYVNVTGYVENKDTSDGKENNDFYKSLSLDDPDSPTSTVSGLEPNYTDRSKIWYFEYDSSSSSYYIQNYLTKSYLTVDSISRNARVKTIADKSNAKSWFIKDDIYEKGTPDKRYVPNSDSKYQKIFLTSGSTTFYLHINRLINDNNTYLQAVLSDLDGGTADANYPGINFAVDKKFFFEKIQTIEDGKEVRIKNNSTSNSEKRLTEGESITFSQRLEDRTGQSYETQFWRFERTNASYPPIYNIVNKKSGKYLTCFSQASGTVTDSSNLSVGAGTVTTQQYTGEDSQKWILIGDDIDHVKLIPCSAASKSHAGYYYDINSHSADKSKVIQCLNASTDGNGTASIDVVFKLENILFSFEYIRVSSDFGDFYTTITPYSGEYTNFAVSASVDGRGGTTTDSVGTVLRKIYADAAIDQKWYFKSVGNNQYVIRNLATGSVLTSLNSGVELTNYKDDNEHKWYILKEYEEGISGAFKGYSIINVATAVDYTDKILETLGTISDESGLNLGAYAALTTWTLDITNTAAPNGAENLGNSFFAYIQNPNSTNYVQCSDSRGTALILKSGLDETTRKNQNNYWKFERNKDGSYTITSCNIQYSAISIDDASLDSGTVKTFDKQESYGTLTNVYNQRWFIRKYSTSYKLECKRNGKVIDFTTAITFSENNENLVDQTCINQFCDIIKTDCAIDADVPNIKINLFDYGQEINTSDDSVLPFTNDSSKKSKDGYVDGFSGDYTENGGYIIPEQTNANNFTMSNTLNSNGYPVVTSNETGFENTGSLEYLFNANNDFVRGSGNDTSYKKGGKSYQSQHFTVESPKGLFKYNSNTGMYCYDSLFNSVYFQRSSDGNGKLTNSGNFKLYDYTTSLNYNGYSVGTPEKANFLPFNLSCEEGDVYYGTKSGDNATNTSADIGERNADYSVNYRLSNSLQEESMIDGWFGMTMECDFHMTANGTYNDKVMQFEFSSNDDAWIYVDGVLVLDMSCNDNVQTGSINFQTGAVILNNGTVTTNYTLKKLFSNALGSDYTDSNFNGEIFKGNTTHKLSFYYLERNGGGSYFKMQFNLPKGMASVSKEVDGLAEGLHDTREYTFQLQDANGSPFTSTLNPGLNKIHYFHQTAAGVVTEAEMNIGGTNQCIFKLKDGESVLFFDIPDGEQYKIVELDPQDKYTVSSTVVKGNGQATSYNNGDVLTADAAKFSEIKYTNTIKTTEMFLTKKVLDRLNDEVTNEILADAIYRFGLEIYDESDNVNYGKLTLVVSGQNLGKRQKITGLPQGASFKLWEYTPEDSNNKYDNPTLSDENGTQNYTGRLVESGSEPAENDFLTGTVDGQFLTVINKLLEYGSITVTFKYYDRKVESGKPAAINNTETSYSRVVDLSNSVYADYINPDNYRIITAMGKALLKKVIIDISASAKTIGNIVDDYDVFISQEEAVNKVTGRKYTLGSEDNYATHTIKADEAAFHTNSKRQPITNEASKEKWITYYKSNTPVDAESEEFIDYDDITNITVWLYNKPREYTVTTHVPDDIGSDANGKDITFTAYYNQRLGVNKNNDLQECYDYCELYSIPLDDYKTLGSANAGEKTYDYSGAPETFGGQEFSYWTNSGGSIILSTDRSYLYRVTGDLDLYARYGETVGKGIFSTDEGIDVYYDADGIKRLRINTTMNPYGFEYGTERGNPNIKYAAAAYLVLKDSNDLPTDEQVLNIQDNIKTKAAEIVTNGLKGTPLKGSSSFTVENVGEVTVVVYEVSESKLLTNKNRLNFMAGYKSPTGDEVKKVLAFTSLYYQDDESVSWYVSDNYVMHTLTSAL